MKSDIKKVLSLLNKPNHHLRQMVNDKLFRLNHKELIELLDNQDSVHVKIEGEIYEVCSKKGC